MHLFYIFLCTWLASCLAPHAYLHASRALLFVVQLLSSPLFSSSPTPEHVYIHVCTHSDINVRTQTHARTRMTGYALRRWACSRCCLWWSCHLRSLYLSAFLSLSPFLSLPLSLALSLSRARARACSFYLSFFLSLYLSRVRALSDRRCLCC